MTIANSRPARGVSVSNLGALDAPNSRPTMDQATPVVGPSGGPSSPAAEARTASGISAPQGTKSTGRHVPSDTRGTGAAGSTSPGAEELAAPNVSPRRGTETTVGQAVVDTHRRLADGSNVPDPAAIEVPATMAGTLLDPALCLAADILDDIERVRIANENRLRQLVRTEVDGDGEERGFGLDPDHPDVMRLGVMIEMLKRVEHDAVLGLQAKMRKHPLGGWVKAQRGVGLKQGARLLAAIGDPYVNSAKGQPRTVSALWAYCGLHVLPGGQGDFDAQGDRAAGGQNRDTDPTGLGDQSTSVGVAAKRRKGERANWSTKAKTRAHLIAESCIKQLSPDCREGHAGPVAQSSYAHEAAEGAGRGGHGPTDAQSTDAAPACACSPYRVVYDQRRAHTATTRPEWTDGHSHNDALRVASKAILRDLWRAARDWHAAEGRTP